jgi:hypothetical protein
MKIMEVFNMKILFFKFILITWFFFLPFFTLSAQTLTPTPVGAPESNSLNSVAKVNQFDYWTPNIKQDPPLTDSRKKLVESGLQWVAQNLQCEEIYKHPSPFDWSKGPYHPVMERCHVLDGVCFGHFENNKSLEMILAVSGGGDVGAHGACYQDEKYILCHSTDKGFFASVVYQYKYGSGMDLVKFLAGPDLLRIKDNQANTNDDAAGPPNAHLFWEINGVMKEVLTYAYGESFPRSNYDFQTRLVPLQNRDLQLIAKEKKIDFNSDDDSSDPKTDVFVKIFHWDPSSNIYKTDGKQKQLSLNDWENAIEPGTVNLGK